jgi:hypothetical protein
MVNGYYHHRYVSVCLKYKCIINLLLLLKAPFKRRCQSGITIPNARTQIYAKLTPDGYYNDGSRAVYRCLENFVHDRQSGPLNIQCKNGRWGPRPKCVRMYS